MPPGALVLADAGGNIVADRTAYRAGKGMVKGVRVTLAIDATADAVREAWRVK